VLRKLLWAFAYILAICAPTLRAQKTQLTIYRGATLIDGTGSAAQASVAIVVRGACILAIRPAKDAIELGSKVIDATGLYVMPGLINSHIHIATVSTREQSLAIMRRDLYSGITAEREMAGDTRQLAELARVALLGEVEGPDIYYAALMGGPSYFTDERTHFAARGAVPGEVPWMKAVTPSTDLHLAVAEARGTGATAIKIYFDLSPELVSAITKSG
jgi:imidazolonepropionase-like amidohydrolase